MNCLDQAVDPIADLFREHAAKYPLYLDNGYDTIATLRRNEFKEHVACMRAALNLWMIQYFESRERRKRRNLAIIGPGKFPIGHEFDRTMVELMLRRTSKIVVADYSDDVLTSAINSFEAAGLVENRLWPKLHDITDGLAWAYDQYILRVFEPIETGADLLAAVDQFAELRPCDLRSIVGNRIGEAMESKLTPAAESGLSFEAQLALARSWSLTCQGTAIPLHLIVVPMVLAGTGAEAEARIWRKMEHVVSGHANRWSGDQPDAFRKRVRQRVHAAITRYNTEVAGSFIEKVLIDNPAASVLIITDVCTLFTEGYTLTRLDGEALRKQLGQASIVQRTVLRGGWMWHDDPQHSHLVEAFSCRFTAGRRQSLLKSRSPSSRIG